MLMNLYRSATRSTVHLQSRFFARHANESEKMLRESVSTYAKSTIQPKVAAMDHDGKMSPEVVRSLFDQVCRISH